MIWSMLAVTLFIGVLLWATPTVNRPTVPLGVSVPSDRIDDPVVTTAVASYRRWVVAATAVAVLADLTLGSRWPQALLTAVPFGLIAAGLAGYLVSRRAIRDAKDTGHWYADHPVAVTASVTRQGSARVPWPAYLAGAIITVGGLGYGLAGYGAQPDPFPTHSNFAGQVDAWAPKSYLVVLGPQALAIAWVALLAVVAWATARSPRRVPPDGNLVAAARRSDRVQLAIQQMLAMLVVVLSAGLTALNVLVWRRISGAAVVVTVVIFLLATLVVTVEVVRRAAGAAGEQRAALRGTGSQSAGEGTSTADPDVPASSIARRESPDDDRFWKGGLIYLNRDDPSFLVPKRFGVGWTINAGHPAGIAFFVGVALLVVGSLALPLFLH